MRNQIMAEAREITSPRGLAEAQAIKEAPKKINDLLNDKSEKIYKKSFSNLTESQKNSIYYEIIESSGRDRKSTTAKNEKLRIMGKVLTVVTATIAVYEIYNADNKLKETARQGMIIGGGFAGGAAGGLAISLVCGPGAPFCAVVTVLVGSAVGGFLGGTIADSLDDELEEYTKWNMN